MTISRRTSAGTAPPAQRYKADRHVDAGNRIMDLKQALREANVLDVNFTAVMDRQRKAE